MLTTKPHTDFTDAELIEHYKRTNSNHWIGILFNRYTGLIYGVCLKYLKNREEAKDATMLLFEKLLATLKEHEVTHFKSWLYVTVRNHCLMKLRAEKGKIPEELSTYIMESAGEMHQEEQDKETNLVALENCIEKLVNEQKACVKLFYLQEKCYKEVATLTGYELNKVKSFIQNGKRNLKICLEQNG